MASRHGEFPHWDEVFFFAQVPPPPPFRAQNLENKGLVLSLCARSLSLKDL